MRLRLKPKLTAEAPVETVAPAPAPEPAIQAFPVVAPPEPATDNGEIPRLKLKPLSSVPPAVDPAAMSAVPAPAPIPFPDVAAVPVPPPMPPPVPSMETGDAPVAPSVPLLKPLAVLKTDVPGEGGVLGEVLVAPPGAPFKPPAQTGGLSIGRILGVCGALLVVLGGGYYVVRLFTATPPAVPAPATISAPKPPAPAPVVVTPPAPAPKAPVTPPTTPVVQAPPVTPSVQTPPVVPPPVKPAPVRTAPQPSTDFLVWVDSAKISGVFDNGNPPRAIVNGLLVRPGDTIDSTRGVVFDHLDVEQKQFFFRDRSGAVTSKSY